MSYIRRLKREIGWIAVFVLVIWGVFVLDQLLPLESFGLKPRRISGLLGIPAMTFLHGSLSHLLANTFPLIALLFLLVGSRANSIGVIIAIVLLGGVLLWLLGRPGTNHIGASLLVFGLAGFLLTSGFFFERKFITLLVSVIVLLSYGGALISGVIPGQKGVSWDGHLYGFVAGVMVAYLQTKKWRFS